MELQAWFTLGVVALLIAAMARELIPPAVAMVGASTLLFLVGITDADAAFAGFSNEAPFVIAALLIVARAVDVAGVMQPVVAALFSGPSSPRVLLARLLFPLAGVSAFLNNTT